MRAQLHGLISCPFDRMYTSAENGKHQLPRSLSMRPHSKMTVLGLSDHLEVWGLPQPRPRVYLVMSFLPLLSLSFLLSLLSLLWSLIFRRARLALVPHII